MTVKELISTAYYKQTIVLYNADVRKTIEIEANDINREHSQDLEEELENEVILIHAKDNKLFIGY